MYKFILILLICNSCTHLQRLQQLQKDAPELFKSRVDTVFNTVTVKGSTLSLVGYNFSSATVINNNMKIIYTPGKDNIYTVQGECFDKTVTIPSYNTFSSIDVEKYIVERVKQIVNKYKIYFILGFGGIILFIILLLIGWRIYKKII